MSSYDINLYMKGDNSRVSLNAFISGWQKLLKLLNEVETYFLDKNMPVLD